jgi:hypothetical protein
VKLTLADGSTQWVHVPLMVMHGHKPVPDDWIVAAPWPWVYPEYELTFTVPSRVVAAELDPMQRTPDVNRLNNTADLPTNVRFLRAPQRNPTAYDIGVRPLAGYAASFGGGVGVQARGAYRDRYHTRAMLTLWPQVIASNGDDPTLDAVTLGRLGRNAVRVRPRDGGSWFTGVDYEAGLRYPVDPLGGTTTLGVTARKHLGLMENRVFAERSIGSVFDDGSQTFRVALQHQYNRSDRVFRSYDPVNPFRRAHLISALLQYDATAGRDRLHVGAELGGSVAQVADRRRAPSANQFSMAARKSFDTGALTLDAAFQFNWANRFLANYKRPHLGGQSFEAQWHDDAFRTAAAAFERPLDDAHLTAFGLAGPVAYLRTDAGVPTAGLIGGNLLAGRLALRAAPFAGLNALSPLRLEAFSGIGETWDDGAFLAGFTADDLLADAGLGLTYDVAAIPHLDRWTAQSDVLDDLSLIARFPLYASDPDRIDPGQSELAFRWLIGVQVQP